MGWGPRVGCNDAGLRVRRTGGGDLPVACNRAQAVLAITAGTWCLAVAPQYHPTTGDLCVVYITGMRPALVDQVYVNDVRVVGGGVVLRGCGLHLGQQKLALETGSSCLPMRM